ncbi:MAG: hypothetical protein AABW79_00760 [Nanoarchaeota archaeon]
MKAQSRIKTQPRSEPKKPKPKIERIRLDRRIEADLNDFFFFKGNPFFDFSRKLKPHESFLFDREAIGTFMEFKPEQEQEYYLDSLRHAGERLTEQGKDREILGYEVIPIKNYFTILGEPRYPQYSSSGYLIFAYVAE